MKAIKFTATTWTISNVTLLLTQPRRNVTWSRTWCYGNEKNKNQVTNSKEQSSTFQGAAYDSYHSLVTAYVRQRQSASKVAAQNSDMESLNFKENKKIKSQKCIANILRLKTIKSKPNCHTERHPET